MPKQNSGRTFVFIQQKIAKAADQIVKQNYPDAQKLLYQSLSLNPNQSKALYLYSFCLKQKGKLAQSTTLLQKSYQLNPCFFQTNKNNFTQIIKSIKENYKNACKSMSNNSNTNDFRWQQIVNLFAKAKDLDTTLQINKLFEKVRKTDDKQYTGHLFSTIGIAYYQMGLYQQSFNQYITAIKLKSTQYRYYNNSAILKYIKGQYLQSQQFVAKSLTQNPGYGKSLFILAFSLCKTGRLDQALQKIYYSISKDSKSTMYRFKILTTLLLYFPDKQQQIKKQLKQTQQIIIANQDTDNYFWCKDNIPILTQIIKFLKQNYVICNNFTEEWKQCLVLLDGYLIKGHVDKYKIQRKLKELMAKIKVIVDNMTKNAGNTTQGEQKKLQNQAQQQTPQIPNNQ